MSEASQGFTRNDLLFKADTKAIEAALAEDFEQPDDWRGGIALDDCHGRPLRRHKEMRWLMSDLIKGDPGEKAGGPSDIIMAFPMRNPLAPINKHDEWELQNEKGFPFKKKSFNPDDFNQRKSDDPYEGSFQMNLSVVEKTLIQLEVLELDVK